MKHVYVVKEEDIKAFKSAQEKIDNAEPGEAISLDKKEWEAWNNAYPIPK